MTSRDLRVNYTEYISVSHHIYVGACTTNDDNLSLNLQIRLVRFLTYSDHHWYISLFGKQFTIG